MWACFKSQGRIPGSGMNSGTERNKCDERGICDGKGLTRYTWGEWSVSAPGLQATPDYFVKECRKLWKFSHVLQCGNCWQVN